MKADINFPKVTDVKMAIAKSINEKGESDWYVYVSNNKPANLSNLMIVSNASEHADGTGRKTSTLRHFIEHLDAHAFATVEPIDPAVFGFYNEFWLSFYIGRALFDKKYIIKPFSEWELDDVEELGMAGRVVE